jgi:hypothetical protein
MRLVHSREALESLRERFGEKVFETVVRRGVRYLVLAEEVLDRVSGNIASRSATISAS